MGLLEQQLSGGLLPATANPNMLAQALKARNQPRKQLNGQGLLDTAAIGLSPVPVIGDALGLAADANRFVNEPESRTPLNFGLAALGAIPFIPPLVSMGLGKFAQSQGKTLGQLPTGPARNQAGAIVYHGSPHKFDQFDSSKIGTGEGAQAYGHGLYFAEKPDVAKSYQYMSASAPTKFAGEAAAMGEDPLRALKSEYPNKPDYWYEDVLKDVPKAKGSLYKVDLPDEAIAKMLDYDKPLKDQPESVKKALSEYANLDWPVSRLQGRIRTADGKLADTEAQLSQALKERGLLGIRYLDGNSRGVGNGTSNFVVFPGNEGLLKILSRE